MQRKNKKLRRNKYKSLIRNTIIVMIFSTLILVIGYSAFSTNITLNAKGNIKERPKIIQSWLSNANTDFHESIYRLNIVSVNFLDDSSIPDSAIQSWDVSEEKDNGVMAWVIKNEEDNSKYDLFIGAKGGILANSNSSYMFHNFANVKIIEFNDNFDTKNATNMQGMFRNCGSLLELDISSFNTANVFDMRNMFDMPDDNSSQLNKIKFGAFFVTSQISDMEYMFANCAKLETIDVSHFDTSSVNRMRGVFNNCHSLKELDLSSWDTSRVKDMGRMFTNDASLEKIYVSDKFTTASIVNNTPAGFPYMFTNNTSLVGGNGTKYDENNVEKEYARIDTPDTPGYFTLKQ